LKNSQPFDGKFEDTFDGKTTGIVETVEDNEFEIEALEEGIAEGIEAENNSLAQSRFCHRRNGLFDIAMKKHVQR